MYNEHFGLSRRPFRITPDTDLFFPGGRRGEILDALVYAITAGEGIVKVVGEVGSGKTMLCRMLELRLPDRVEVVYLANPSLTPGDILHAIALEMELELDPEASRVQAMHALQRCLLDKHAAGRRVVVLVEEAQGMPIATLEEIRLLSNLETKRDKLLQIALFGQPELDQLLDQPEIRQLRERITYSFELKPLSAAEIQAYLTFRLRAVGYRGRDVFRKRAYAAMAGASEGLTRRVNILADKALLAAYAEDAHDVARRHVKVAIQDSEFGRKRRSRAPELAVVFGLVSLAIALLLVDRGSGAGWWPFSVAAKTVAASPTSATPSATTPTISAAATRAATTASPLTSPSATTPAATPTATSATTPAAAGVATAGAESPIVVAPGAVQPPARHETVAAIAREVPEPVAADAGENTAAAPGESGSSGPDPEPTAVGGNPAAGKTPTGKTVVTGRSAGLVLSARLVASAESGDGAQQGDGSDAPADAKVAVPPAPSATTVVTAAAAPEPARASAPIVRKPDQSVTATLPETPQSIEPQPAVELAVASGSKPAETSSVSVETPDGGPTGTLIGQRLAATRSWLRRVDAGYYSIQLMVIEARRRRNLEAFLRARARAGDLERIFVYQARIGKRARFGVLYGVYSTLSTARDALARLAPDLARYRPFIRNVRDVAWLG